MRRGAGIAGNPVLIGAATVLVVLVAVFLAYNANQGLPFVPTYELKAEVPSAANLVRGNDVRIGGSRVGFVSAITPQTNDDGVTVAVLTLTLEKSVAPLPRDSTLIIRSRSALGLKYVEITRGTDARGLRRRLDDPDQPPPRRAPVELDEVLSMFDDKTRVGVAAATTGFGDAFAGRGESINTAIGSFKPLLRDVIPVAQNLSSPETDLRGFFRALGRTAAIVAPAAEDQAELFVNLDITFRALREVVAVHPGVDRRRRARRSTPASATSRSSGRSCATASCCSATCARAPPRCARTRRRSPTRSRRAPRSCRARRRSTAGSRRCSRSCSASPRTRWSRAA